jgi:hypothetical protein
MDEPRKPVVKAEPAERRNFSVTEKDKKDVRQKIQS